MRALLLLLALSPALSGAAELLVERRDGNQRYSSAELLAHPASRTLEIPADVAYKRPMRYRALPLAELLPGVRPEDHLQAVADDGFAAELPAAALLDAPGARAWLAVEDSAAPWPALGKAGKSAGPFYLVWSNPEQEQIGPEQWPFRMVRLRVLAPVAERFPALRPDPALALDDQVISINSFSKYFNMTGWRLGWLVVPEALVPVIERLAQNLFICPSTVAQHAALACFEPDTLAEYERRRAEFKARRDFFIPALNAIGLAVPVTPDGAFYAWADCTAACEKLGVKDSWEFAFEVMRRAHVAVTPGRDFGTADTSRFVRFSTASSMDHLHEAAERLGALLR